MFEQIYSKLKCEQCGSFDKLYIDRNKNIECYDCARKFAEELIAEKDYDLQREIEMDEKLELERGGRLA